MPVLEGRYRQQDEVAHKKGSRTTARSEIRAVTLTFPNASRSYETRNRRILFWGHDRMREVSFFIDVAAIAKMDPPAKASEDDWLEAFDRLLDRIHDVARRAYVSSRDQQVHLLTVQDF